MTFNLSFSDAETALIKKTAELYKRVKKMVLIAEELDKEDCF